MTILLVLGAFVVGVIVGAFSHKYLAKETTALTGVDPNSIAAKINKNV